jgi:hypothetical protein
MIFSIHIPKTAGTSFRRALEERYGSKLALYYGVHDPKTTDSLRVPREKLAEAAARLPEAGYEVLHGHYPLRFVAPLLKQPSAQVWTWLRDPVERTLSHFDFYRERPLELTTLARRVKAGEVDLETFSDLNGMRDLQSRYLKGLPLERFAFVGVVEQFELGLALLFGDKAPALARRYNATMDRAAATAGQRMRIAINNPRDMQLYAQGLRLLVERLVEVAGVEAPDRPSAAGPTLMKRLMSRVA